MSDDQKPKRGLTPEKWVEVRKKYEAGASEAALSRDYRIHRRTVHTRVVQESWMVQPTVHVGVQEAKAINGKAQAKVISIATGLVIEKAEADGTIAALHDVMKDSLEQTARLSLAAAAYASKMLEDGLNGKIEPGRNQSHADVFKTISEGYRIFVATTREAAGIRIGAPSTPDVGGLSTKPSVVRLVVVRGDPAPIAVNE